MPQTTSVFGLVEQDLIDKKYSQAMRRLVMMSNEFSKDLRYLSLLSFTQRALGDHTGQLKTLKVIADNSQNQVAHLDYMAALYAQGFLNEALDVGLYLQDLKLEEVNSQYFTRMMARLYLEFSDYEGLYDVLHQYEQNHSLDDLMCWSLGVAFLAEGDKTQAIEFFRRAIDLNAANDQAWISLAMLHEEMGDRELALANLERALDANPNNKTGLKLMSKWCRRDLQTTQDVLERLSYYLKKHSFDEDVSLCYVQLLREHNLGQAADFEIEKLRLQDPKNADYAKLALATAGT